MFKDILLDVSNEIGVTLATQLQKKSLISLWINQAAEDLYTSDDLPGCLREQVFDLDLSDGMVTLPWYVYKIRGLRNVNWWNSISQHDHRMRYSTNGYKEFWNYGWMRDVWRVKEVRAIGRSITNAAPLTLKIPLPETVAFAVNITGSNNNSVRLTEKITFSAGVTEMTTVNSFINPYNEFPIESIIKNIPTTYDLTIKDANDLEIAKIPNSELSSRYTVIQVFDNGVILPLSTDCNCTEVLFKYKLSPMLNDFDSFPCPGFDKAIFYKFMENYKGKNGELDQAVAYKIKCKEICDNLNNDDNQNKEMKIDFGVNKFLEVQRTSYPGDICTRRFWWIYE